MEIMAQVAAIAMEHHKLNEEKNLLRNLLSNIIDSMPSVMIGVDQNGDVVLWNKEAEKNTGIVHTEAKGQKLVEVYSDLQSTIVQGVEQAIVTGEIQPVVKNVCRVGGQSIYQDITVYPLSAGGR